ncbi:MAG: CDC27 family protein, partial [Nanoarchaeota archaeon]
NIKLDKEEFEDSVPLCELYAVRHPESSYNSSFLYMKALALFSMRKYNEASETAKLVAEGDSEDRDLANYILGQISHTEHKPEDAINYYRRVAFY